VISAKGIDIQSTAPCVTSIDRELLWFALTLDIAEDSFNAMFMKFTFLPESNQVTQ
jgi:hypothetical protein